MNITGLLSFSIKMTSTGTSQASPSYTKFLIFNIFLWNRSVSVFVSCLHFQYVTVCTYQCYDVSAISVVII